MDLTPYAEHLRSELLVAADAGGEEARALAERLIAPLDSAVRLTLLDALSAAADEITRESAPGSVELRLRGGQPEFVVTAPPAAADAADDVTVTPAATSPALDTDEGATARISLRVPEALKAAIDDAASAAQVSVNTWLVRAAAAAVSAPPPPPGGPAAPRPRARGGAFGGDSFTGWAR